MSIQNKGITFIRNDLSRQDRKGHFGAKGFKDNELLDHKRRLLHYENYTNVFRLKEPHKAITSQTISH
jgi:hypothetical protein